MNPYAKYLGDRDPLEAIIETSARIDQISSILGVEGSKLSYEEGKWTAAQIYLHLFHIEIMFGTRFRQTLTTDGYVVQPFDQDEWMNVEPDPDWETVAPAFSGLRKINLKLFRSFSQSDLEKEFIHPELGPMKIKGLLEVLAGHDLNHLGQLELIAARVS